MKIQVTNLLAFAGLLIGFIIILGSCDNSNNKYEVKNELDTENSISEEKQGAELVLETLFFYTLSELEIKFGKNNVLNRFNKACETCGPEGTPTYKNSYTTILFPDTKNAVTIEWDSRQKKVEWVTLFNYSNNDWITKEGFRLGDNIEEINRYYNQKPVDIFFENIWYYSVNDHYTLNFYSDDTGGDSCSPCKSTDKALKNLVLVGISIKQP
jgi:hypothetical protein